MRERKRERERVFVINAPAGIDSLNQWDKVLLLHTNTGGAQGSSVCCLSVMVEEVTKRVAPTDSLNTTLMATV
jgi:hypothetical protein